MLVNDSHKQFLKENQGVKFNDIFKVKNKWVKVSKEEKTKLAEEFFKLISIAYHPLEWNV